MKGSQAVMEQLPFTRRANKKRGDLVWKGLLTEEDGALMFLGN